MEAVMVKTYERICDECGEEYRGVGVKYCSVNCYVNSRWTECVCHYCGREFKARKVWVNRGQMKYCSVECSSTASRSFPVVDYGGDRFYFRTGGGYYTSSKTGRKLHRVIWEDIHGPIPEKCVVHHIDGDTTNNKVENLELMGWGAHSSYHNRERWNRGTRT